MTASSTAPGGYTEADMWSILRQACEVVGLNAEGAEVLRGHTNAVLRLHHHPVVVKIARLGTPPEATERTVRFTRWLMDAGFPTAPLLECDQPVLVDGQHAATFWVYLPQPTASVTAEQLAKPLQMLHTLGRPPFALPEHDNVRAIRRSLAVTTTLPAADLHFLSSRADQLEGALEDVVFEYPPGVIQGDPQHRNALHTGGSAVLCDWDTAAIGQPEWDLVTVEVHSRRFGYGKEHYDEFAAAYGFDVTRWPGYETLRDLRELRMITTNARKARHTPGSIHEVERRVQGLRRAEAGLPWRIL
ncbi:MULTISPECIES: phosphotransferase [unclassified Streptomyces]|uniref:phosphotransferase family protein n=1 Tax=unclassified Streptomyces TaxID=2593676 RepID=UPI000DC7A002|nr:MULTISPECIES: phosphotransferase [unclassified Streptomyces]AWZ03541.1 aminoglycoside phosphotransferase family protein [Streptomyces sp. ICC4]AWZ12600.1 aminoglycoside phosphotransferase family protein [Streptomyces sp. ICC1]